VSGSYIDNLTGTKPGTSIEPVIVAQLIYFDSLLVVGKRRLHRHDGGSQTSEWTSASDLDATRSTERLLVYWRLAQLIVVVRDTEQVAGGHAVEDPNRTAFSRVFSATPNRHAQEPNRHAILVEG
jgi:hypothetical protein